LANTRRGESEEERWGYGGVWEGEWEGECEDDGWELSVQERAICSKLDGFRPVCNTREKGGDGGCWRALAKGVRERVPVSGGERYQFRRRQGLKRERERERERES
jgi:hypothetical protein